MPSSLGKLPDYFPETSTLYYASEAVYVTMV